MFWDCTGILKLEWYISSLESFDPWVICYVLGSVDPTTNSWQICTSLKSMLIANLPQVQIYYVPSTKTFSDIYSLIKKSFIVLVHVG